MMHHDAKSEFPSAFHNKHVNAQSCIMSTFTSINIAQFFRQTNPKIVI